MYTCKFNKHKLLLLLIICNVFSRSTGQSLSKPTSQDNKSKRGIQFSFSTEGPIRSTPAIKGNMLYLGSGDGKMYAIDKLTGKEFWHFITDGPVFSSPEIVQTMVLFTSRDHFLYALESQTGKLIWKYKFGNDLTTQNFWDFYLSSPKSDGRNVYIGSGDGYFYCLDVRTGKVNWKYFANARIRTTPSLSSDKIVFGTMEGYVIALNKKGKEDWKFATDGVKNKFADFGLDGSSVFCNPAIKDGIVSFGGRDFKLYALDLATGKELWRFKHPNSWVLSTSIYDSKVYAGSGSAGFVHASELKTGKQLWQFKTKSAVYSYYAFADGLVYFGDLTGNIYGLDAQTGETKWLFPMGSNSFSTPIVENGLVYCSSDNGILYAVHGTTNADNSFANAKKIVYWEGNLSDSAYHYFNANVDLWIRDYLKRQDYELMNAEKLNTYMTSKQNDASGSVIVFADDKVPQSIIEGEPQSTIIRKYLDAGGKIVFLGINPLFIKTDPKSGVIRDLNTDRASAILGINFTQMNDTYGHHIAKYTKEGNRLGLKGFINGFWPVEPDMVSSVLAYDEYGKAEVWIKQYGGKDGSGLLQFIINPPNIIGSDFFGMRAAIEYGITW